MPLPPAVRSAATALVSSLTSSVKSFAVDAGTAIWGFLSGTRAGKTILGLGIGYAITPFSYQLGTDIMMMVVAIAGLRYLAHVGAQKARARAKKSGHSAWRWWF